MKAITDETLVSRGLCLFTGAGVSFDPPTGLPLGDELVHDYLLAHLISAPLLEHLPKGALRPEVVMNIFCKHLGEEFLTCLAFFKDAPPNELHEVISRVVSDERVHQLVTTNLDLCHETASSSDRRGSIVHLHGEADDPKSILYALDQVASARPEAAIAKLKAICEGRTVIFLGYSGRDDFDIAPALRSLPSSTHLVWVQHQPRTTGFSVTEPTHDSDAWSILAHRQLGSWTYVTGSTLEFCRSLARQLSVQLPMTSVNVGDRESVAEFHRQALRSLRPPLTTQESGMVCADLLCLHLNQSEEAIAILSDIKPPTERKPALNYWTTLAIAAQRAGKHSVCRDAIGRALDITPDSSQSLRILADAEYRLNEFNSAMLYVEQALDRAQNQRQRGHALSTKALILQDTEREDEAFGIYTELVPLLHDCGDLYALSDCLNNRAALYLDENQAIKAEDDYTEALRIRALIDHKQGLCFCYLGLGIARRFRFCVEGSAELAFRAHEALDRALATLPKESSPRDRFLVFKNRGDLFIDQGLCAYALETLTCARGLAERLQGSFGECFSCDLSLYELALLTRDDGLLADVTNRLKELSNQRQLPDKLYWYNQLCIGCREGFMKLDLDQLPVEIYRHRVKQLRSVRP